MSGFTIVELMIATAVFSVILVAITVGVLHFSAQYYKGVYTSETQNVARDITDEVANAVKYGADEPETSTDTAGQIVFCAGGYVFVTVLGEQYTESNGTKGLYMQPKNAAGCTVPTGTVGRKQLLAKNMRVAALKFTQVNDNLYTLQITVAYGDDDLLTQTSDSNFSGAVQCKIGAGSEYCAVSSLVTSMEKRI